MEDEDDEGVGARLSRIQQQRKKPSASSSSSSDEEEFGEKKRKSAPSPIEVVLRAGLSQDSLPRPVVVKPPLPVWSTHKAKPNRASPGTTLPPLHQNQPPLDYRDDPFSPFAVGGFMYKPPPSAVPPAAVPPAAVPPAAPSRAASPAVSSRAESPSTDEPKKKKGKKTQQDIEEEAALQIDINSVIESFREEYRPYIKCVEEQDMKNQADKEFYSVAKWLTIKKPNPRTLDLAMFSSKQIRRLAFKSGVKGGGNMTLFQARIKIATAINMGTVYNEDTISNPRTEASQRKVNTLMRILNVCFHKSVKDKFIDLNDPKKRKDYEAAHGGNPIKDFWKTVSELTNDPLKNPVFGVVLEAQIGEDSRLRGFVLDGVSNLNDFTLQTYLSCQQNVNDCMKAREACLRGGLRISGHHSNDMWDYVNNTAFTIIRKGSQAVPGMAVYYCHVLCVKHPEIDGKFAPFLNEALKSDSEVPLRGVAGSTTTDSGNKKKTIDALVATIATATADMSKAIQARSQQQQSEARNERGTWDEYFDVSQRFLSMAKDNNNLPLLSVMAIRLRMLEKSLGISTDQSVTNGVDGIPPIAEVVTVALTNNKDSTSDVTSPPN
jgi:hypothetical protein